MFREAGSLEPSLSISPHSLWSPSLLGLDHTDIFKSFGTTRAPSVSVLGRRINSESIISPSSESTSRFPIAIQSPKVKCLSPQLTKKANILPNDSNKKEKEIKHKIISKTPEPLKVTKPISSNFPKQLSSKIIKKISRKPSVTPQPKINSDEIKTEKLVIDEFIHKISIDRIISKSLRKQKLSKDLEEKKKYEEIVQKQKNKWQLDELNKQTRIENLRFKKNEFKPKIPWGADERRINGEIDEQIRKGVEEIRKKHRENREKSKQLGKASIGLDDMKWRPSEKLKTPKPTATTDTKSLQKKIKQSDPEIVIFMKTQKKLRKLQKELDYEKQLEEESKRIFQLNRLESHVKANLKKFKKKKQKEKKKEKIRNKILKKKPKQESIEVTSYPEDEEVKEIMYGMPPESAESYNREGRECQAFGNYSDNQSNEKQENATQLVSDIVERRVHQEPTLPLFNATMPILEVKETTPSYTDDPSEEIKTKDLQSSDVIRRKNEIHKKLNDLKNRVDRARENAKYSVSEEDLKNSAAIKIQAWVRGWLTREALRRFFNNLDASDDSWLKRFYGSDGQVSFEDEDEEVQKILKKIGKPDNLANGSSWEESDLISPRNFQQPSNLQKWEISSPGSQFARFSPVPVKNQFEDSARMDSHFCKLSSVLATSSHEIIEKEKNDKKTDKNNQRKLKEILESQTQWKLSQKQKLNEMKEKDLKEMKKIAKKAGNDTETMKFLQELIEQRYSSISKIFDEAKSDFLDSLENSHEERKISKNIIKENQKKSLIKAIDFEENDEYLNTDSEIVKSVRVSKLDIEKPDTDIEEAKEEQKQLLNDIEEFTPYPDKKHTDISNSFIEQIKALQLPTSSSISSQDLKFTNSISPEVKAEDRDSPEFVPMPVEKFPGPQIFDKNDISLYSEPIEAEFIEEYSQSFSSFQEDTEIENKDGKIEKEISLDLNSNESANGEEKNESSSLIECDNSPYDAAEPEGIRYILSDSESKQNSPANKNAAIFIQEWNSPETSSANIKNEISIETPNPENLIDMAKFEEKISKPFNEEQCEEMIISDALENICNQILSLYVYEAIKQLMSSPDFLVKITDFILFDLVFEEIKNQPHEVANINISTENSRESLNKNENYVQSYTEKLLIFVLENFEISEEVQAKLLTPIEKNPLDQLSKMQENEIGSIKTPDVINDPVLSPEIYFVLEKDNKIDSLDVAESIHNKMIFDTINEELQKHRKDGEKGLPMPWSSRSPSTSNIINIYEIFNQTRDRIIEYDQIKAGIIPTADLSPDSIFFKKIRDEKLAKLLTLEVVENEQQWVDYEFEETQVRLDLADMMLEQLVAEIVEILYMN
ncbi:unnamed protein product [Blepharisma stoltei]|uniref:DUF4378 domain-containing protein n=1 Tax=Blepharisma stoltei TaxID=1481888 RepID=A0AAU9IW50_9CILI|nr:unnamed protein product [Blepharisma stoltei]